MPGNDNGKGLLAMAILAMAKRLERRAI